jgi:hypothetical protein
MPDFLETTFLKLPEVSPAEILIRLLLALALGGAVAWIYRRTRNPGDVIHSFPATLVLLAVLIAMVTQVIGDNIARAFSLVGALSIVRFRTVVRDTQDTAYVIFAVVVGMAVGAKHLWVGIVGIGVVALAAALMRRRAQLHGRAQSPFTLNLRVALGHDLDKLLGALFDTHLLERELVAVSTARQGVALDVTYETRLRPGGSPETLVKALNRVEGVQDAKLERLDRD